MENETQFKRQINGYESFSQAYQDLFVRLMTNFKTEGTYVEIGAGHPQDSNNTYILERDLQWSGLSVEINHDLCSVFSKIRRNMCLQADAAKVDFESLLVRSNLPKQIDYLSIDIEPANVTLQALKKLPLTEFRFSVITFEHDFYTDGPSVMNEARQIFDKHGYKRVASNVKSFGRDFEDWYVDPRTVHEFAYGPFLSEGKECKDLFTFLSAAGEV